MGPARARGRAVSVWGGVAIAVAVLVGWGVYTRIEAREKLRAQSDDLARVSVVVTSPAPAGGGEDLVLPGTLNAWMEAPIYARTSGYLKRWQADIGQRVKAGQLLAQIDAPEVDQQLRQAQADWQTAKANADLAQSTAQRWQAMLASDSVSRQDAEEKMGDAKAKQAALASAEANVRRLAELQSFERVVAPFDGVVTQRNVDVGALVDAGGTAPQPLFRVADMRRLRVYVQVPEVDAPGIRLHTEAELHVAERAQQTFKARVIATASALDPSTRTLLTQLEVDNAKAELLPGGYAEVHFKMPPRPGAFRLPANTLMFRANGMNVAVVDGHQRLLVKPIILGRDFGKEVEVIGGLSATDRVVLNPPDSAQTGDEVRVTKEMPAN